jgi:hypothetical protein
MITDISNMTITDINNEIKKLENQLIYWLNRKEQIFNLTQPQVTDFTKEKVKGNTREDKFASYVIKNEVIDPHIEEIQNEIEALATYIDSELERIEEYDPLMRQIIKLKEVDKLIWNDIAIKVNYSERQCRRIYIKWKKQRNI